MNLRQHILQLSYLIANLRHTIKQLTRETLSKLTSDFVCSISSCGTLVSCRVLSISRLNDSSRVRRSSLAACKLATSLCRSCRRRCCLFLRIIPFVKSCLGLLPALAPRFLCPQPRWSYSSAKLLRNSTHVDHLTAVAVRLLLRRNFSTSSRLSASNSASRASRRP